MPVIGVPTEELRRRVGDEVQGEKLLDVLGNLGCDVEGFATLRRPQCNRCGFIMELAGQEDVPPQCANCGTDLRDVDGAITELDPLEVVRMELLAVRPDMFDPAGLARAIRGVLDLDVGPVEYQVEGVAAKLRVDPSVRRPESLRPHIACAVIEGVNLDHDSIKSLMKLQENLHWALGRNRKHASIGVYDLDSWDGSLEFEYTTEPPDYAFVPLGAEAGETPWSLERILEEHPKGTAYRNLLDGFDRYPVLRTQGGQVLSMPPIINSEKTKVHLGTRRFFIDVTGSGARIVQRTLSILATSILEYHHGSKLRAVELIDATDPDDAGSTRTLTTPDLTPQEMEIDADRTARLLGVEMSASDLQHRMLQMRHGASLGKGSNVKVLVPAFRNDILHERDLMEDAAIAYGYANIVPTRVETVTTGKELPTTTAAGAVRDVLVGMGYLEILTLTLTSHELSDGLLGLGAHPQTVIVGNPISQEQTQLRTSLLSGLLHTFARNRHNALPQRIFEVGEVSFLAPESETGALETLHFAFGSIAPKVGFADVRAEAESLLRDLGIGLRLERADVPFLIPGRGAYLLTEDGRRLGVFGEVHPAVLERLGLQNPAVLLEALVPTKEVPGVYRSLA